MNLAIGFVNCVLEQWLFLGGAALSGYQQPNSTGDHSDLVYSEYWCCTLRIISQLNIFSYLRNGFLPMDYGSLNGWLGVWEDYYFFNACKR